MRAETMLFVKDVEATSKWYQEVLGMQSGHGGPEFEMLMDGDTLLLQLHELDADHDHGVGLSAPVGQGVLVYIHVADAHKAYERVKALDVPILAELEYNPQAAMTEFTIRDPNGYAIGVCKSKWG